MVDGGAGMWWDEVVGARWGSIEGLESIVVLPFVCLL